MDSARKLALALVSLAATAGSVAAAPSDAASPQRFRNTQVGITVGVDTPAGTVAVEGAWRPLRWIELAAAVGASSEGAAVSVSPRLRWGGRHWAGTIGLGAAVGRYFFRGPGCFPLGGGCGDPIDNVATALLTTSELGVQYTAKRGVFVRAATGGWSSAWHGEVSPTGAEELAVKNTHLYVQLTGGYAF